MVGGFSGMTTEAKAKRQDARGTSGRYVKNPCECCSGPAPMNYFSDPRCNSTGLGVVLCKRCADKLAMLDDDAFAAAFMTPEKAQKRVEATNAAIELLKGLYDSDSYLMERLFDAHRYAVAHRDEIEGR